MTSELEKFLPRSIVGVFQAMDVAEDRIAAAVGTFPNHREKIQGSFRLLCPRMHILGEVGVQSLASHCDEILDRVVMGQDTTLATAVECCVGLSEMATMFPLKHEYLMVYSSLFVDAFGEEKAVETLGAEMVRRAVIDREESPRVVEIRVSLREKMSDPERR